MAFLPTDVGADEDLAREVLVVARGIAPCLESIAEQTEEWMDARAVLRRVYRDVEGRGSRLVKSQRIGSASVEYVTDVVSAFDGSARRALRSLCAAVADGGHSVGSFPVERPVSRVWREEYR